MAEQELHFGLHAVAALLESSPERVQELRCQAGRQDRRLQQIRRQAEAAGVSCREFSRAELDEMVSGRHQGVVAVAEPGAAAHSEADLPALIEAAGPKALVLVLDGITDPHNLGACLRSADAAGVCAVVVPRDKAVGLTPVVSKVACGAAESVPFIQVTNLARSLRQLQELGVWLVGLAGEADMSLYQVDLRGPVALVLGAEGSGMRRLTKEVCDYLVKLPMAGSVSSLNVSVATGISLFEAVRQRQSGVVG